MPRMRKYGESKTTRIMMATVPHVTSGLGLRKFQADGFLLTRMYERRRNQYIEDDPHSSDYYQPCLFCFSLGTEYRLSQITDRRLNVNVKCRSDCPRATCSPQGESFRDPTLFFIGLKCVKGKGKDKIHPNTGHGEQRYTSTFSLTSALDVKGCSTPRPGRFTPGKEKVPIVQEAGWAPGPCWTGTENLASTGIRSPDRPAHSQSL